MASELLWVLAAAVVGAVVGVRCTAWLRSHRHRYEDEVELPARSTWWVLPACVVVPVLAVLAWPGEPVVAVYAPAALVLIVLAAVDLDVFRLPDALTKPLCVGVGVGLFVVAMIGDDLDAWVRALICGVVLGAIYLALVLIGSGSGMGLGDAKLALSLGMLLGYQSIAHVFVGSLVSFLIAGVAAVYLMAFRGATRKSHLAFGPYLVAGTLIVLVAPAVGHL